MCTKAFIMLILRMKFTADEPIAIRVTEFFVITGKVSSACYFAIISVLTFIYLRSEYSIWLKLLVITVEWLDWLSAFNIFSLSYVGKIFIISIFS